MPSYAVSDAVLRSGVPFPELPPCTSPRADVRFELLDAPIDDTAVTWYHRAPDPPEPAWTSFGRHGAGYLVRFPQFADFAIDTRGGVHTVRCVRRGGAGDATLRHLLLDQILPLLFNRGARVALHASAVTMTGGAVAFAGPSGAGKSTLSAACWLEGDALLTDDSLVVAPERGRALAFASYPSVRLWPDAVDALWPGERAGMPVAEYTRKLRFMPSPRAGAASSSVLRALYLLAPSDGASRPRIVPLSRRDGFLELLAHVYRLDPYDRAEVAREADVLLQVAALVPIRRLEVPSGVDALSRVRQLVLDDVAAS